jgi:hypothetical protein
MVDLITPDDLAPFADIEADKAAAMIADAVAAATLYAPCITSPEFLADPVKVAQAKAVLRGAILRWEEAGTGAVTQQSAGPFAQSIDTRTARRQMYYPTEVEQLRDLCAGATTGAAFGLDTLPAGYGVWHRDVCSLHFGAAYCSCGADLTLAGPLYEGPPAAGT